MSAAGEPRPARWATAVWLFLAVMALKVVHALPLVLFPLAVLLVGLSSARPRRWLGLVLVVWIALALPADTIGSISRGWALLLGATYLAATALRPQWPVLSRALTAVSVSMIVSAAWLAATDSWGTLDHLMDTHFHSVATFALGELGAIARDPAWVGELIETSQRLADVQWRVFPALLALQSLAALGLASWWVTRMRARGKRVMRLRPLREFRFNDQLVWVALAGVALLVVPLGALASRVGLNAVVFMGGLYALRGLGVFAFLAGAPSLFTLLFGVVAAIFLYPLFLTAALVVGFGDTWLDVRRRVTAAPRA